jgi:hypothetical protein
VKPAQQRRLSLPLSQLRLCWLQLHVPAAGLQTAAPADQQQQLRLPEERPQVASRLLCSRVRTVKEAYQVT